ncbi:hypothetical protein [Actinomadura nitritigenes]|uniref:Uncharacterized protein n=1 Tax=Actinomadura nitritigenes TaxID=134602 RepID=A0ABS3RCW7_9ACTN|nr:hypothetical protein [Actinomadura nitritigenes]MBO2443424.1 hypothetical protein [Actinomadura nitritigenes]
MMEVLAGELAAHITTLHKVLIAIGVVVLLLVLVVARIVVVRRHGRHGR